MYVCAYTLDMTLRSVLPRARFSCVSSCYSGAVDSSFRALSGRLKFTVRRHEDNKESLLL